MCLEYFSLEDRGDRSLNFWYSRLHT